MNPEDRSCFIGSSDAPAILGVSPWKTAVDVWRQKLNLIDGNGGIRPDSARGKILMRGKRLEPYVLAMLAEERGIVAVKRNVRYVDPACNFLAAEIDGETDDGRNIEVKTVSPFRMNEWGEAGTDNLPLHYVAQVQHQLMVTGRQMCFVPVLFGADDFEVYEVERDDDLITRIRQREIDFWNLYVIPRSPPPIATQHDLQVLFPHDIGKEIEATPEIFETCMMLKDFKATAKAYEAKIEKAELEVKAFMEDAAGLRYADKLLCTWKTQTAKRLDVSAIRESMPLVYQQYCRDSESRVFRVK